MMRRILFYAAAIASASAFTMMPPPSASTTQLFGGARGVSTTLEGKQKTVETVKSLLDTSEMIFSVPSSSLTVAQTETLRRSLPPGTVAKVVKNKLFSRASAGTEYEQPTAELMKGANMWFFIGDDLSGSIKAYNSFIKAEGLLETHSIIGGALEGNAYDGKGVDGIGKLPSKQELYGQIAGAIQAVPTQVARVLKAPSSKLARAIKLATEENK